MLSVGSVCSGAGGFDLGFRNAGYRTAWLCEFDPWRQQLLAQNFPGVKCWPDLSTLDPAELERPDVLIGGTPCQDLSVAGQRAGLDGERSGLFWDYMRVRNELGIEWAVWENVAGALSSNDGLDFASVLGAFVGADVPVPAAGWGGAGVVAGPWGGAVWRLLDAQHFGVPQRRRRVFVVGRLGGPCPPEVLLEPASGGGDSQARGGAGTRAAVASPEGIAGTLDKGRRGYDANPENRLVAHTFRAAGFDASEDGTGRGTPLVSVDRRQPQYRLRPDGTELESGQRAGDSFAARSAAGRDGAPPDADGVRAPDGLAGRMDGPAVTAITENQRGEIWETAHCSSVNKMGGKPGQGYPAVRISGDFAEVERCAVDPQPDGRRYAACGDGVVAPVAEWIARRLMAVIDAELVPQNGQEERDAA